MTASLRSILAVAFLLLILVADPVHAAVHSAGDLDGTGSVDAVDVQLVINAALGFTVQVETNVDHDALHLTNAVDIQLVINAALSLTIDTDGDGLCDAAEANLGTNASESDSDGDGVDDGQELIDGTDPTVPDVATSTVWRVKPGGTGDGTTWDQAFGSIQDAINAASTAGGGEVWVAAGTYTGAGGEVTETFTILGASNTVTLAYSVRLAEKVSVYGGFVGAETTRDERDWTTHKSIIDGEAARLCVYGASDSALDGLTLQNGKGQYGAGLCNHQTSPAVVNCDFVGNSASIFGGGMLNYEAAPTVTDCTFSDNLSAQRGAGVLNYKSSPSFTRVSFANNVAKTAGGGMYNYESSSPALASCSFNKNKANSGGGMCNDRSSSPSLTACAFQQNSALYGGAMENYSGSSPIAADCEFSHNWANSKDGAGGGGGAVYNYDSTLSKWTNCIFVGNGAAYSGGGMYNEQASPVLVNCTFVGNTIVIGNSGGSGMYNLLSSPVVTNCILWDTSTSEIRNSGFSSAPVVTYSCVAGGYAGVSNIASDPLFVDTANDDYRLQAGSPCLDIGTATGAPSTDFLGVARPQGAGYDMGAYERPVK